MINLEPGSVLGGYRILARLRAGAMGVLYLGRREGPAEFSRPVAIKVIHEHLAQNARFRRMFIDEARLSARIDHPNVVRVEEFGDADGRTYLVMEYVNGVSLAQAIGVLHAAGRMPIEQAVAIAIAVAGGLHGAHEATDEAGVPLGIVHRDVSPHNVLVSYTGSVRVIDFGIAKARQVGGQTQTGSLRGKLAYMPPEQARSARTVDRRADLYSLGLVLWEMLTFRRVFDATTDVALMNQIRSPVIVPPSALAPSVPRALDELVLRTLAADPGARPQTGLELQRALGEALPAALRVLPSDLGALMTKVRTTATSLAEGHDDPTGLYGEEIRRTLTLFGKQMHEEVDSPDAVDTRPRARPGGRVSNLDSVIIAGEADEPGMVYEDETTTRLSAPPVARPQPSAPPPHALPPQASPSHRAMTRVIDVPPPSPLTPTNKLALAIAIPTAAALLVALGIVIGSCRDTPPSASVEPLPAGVDLSPPTRVPPVVPPVYPGRPKPDDGTTRPPAPRQLPAGLPADRQ